MRLYPRREDYANRLDEIAKEKRRFPHKSKQLDKERREIITFMANADVYYMKEVKR